MRAIAKFYRCHPGESFVMSFALLVFLGGAWMCAGAYGLVPEINDRLGLTIFYIGICSPLVFVIAMPIDSFVRRLQNRKP